MSLQTSVALSEVYDKSEEKIFQEKMQTCQHITSIFKLSFRNSAEEPTKYKATSSTKPEEGV